MQTNLESVAESLEWRVYMSSLASLGTGLDADPVMTQMFRDAAHAFGESFVEFFKHACTVFGLRTRQGMTIEEFALSVSAVIEGVGLRINVNPQLASIKRPTGVDGAPQSWNAAAIAVEALVLTWTEPDPGAEVSAALCSWTKF